MQNYKLLIQQAAREYVESIFYHDDLEKPEFQDAIDCCIEDFCEGVEYAHTNRYADSEQIETAAIAYAKDSSSDSDVDAFTEGAEWYREHYPTVWSVIRSHGLLLWLCALPVGCIIIAIIRLFNHG